MFLITKYILIAAGAAVLLTVFWIYYSDNIGARGIIQAGPQNGGSSKNSANLQEINASESPTATSNGSNLSSVCSKAKCNRPILIGIVNPTFTAAAYNNSFYVFYKNYDKIVAQKMLTKTLNLLTTSRIPSTSLEQTAVDFLKQHILSLKNGTDFDVSILSDVNVHRGLIFAGPEGIKDNSSSLTGIANAFDILVLFHQEYVTQQEYDNLKTFVANGGTLFVMDGNPLIAEVRYNADSDTITLVNGHGFQFDGTNVKPSVFERWANETSDWMGSNYLFCDCTEAFGNDPFGYNHHEEQYVTNAKARIILDYKVHVLKDYELGLRGYKPVVSPTIATYEMNFVNGKSIVFGLYSSDIITNKHFLEFFDKLLYASVFGSPIS